MSYFFWLKGYKQPVDATFAKLLSDTASDITDPVHAQTLAHVIESYQRAEQEFLRTATIPNRSTMLDLLTKVVEAAWAEAVLKHSQADLPGALVSVTENRVRAVADVLRAVYPEVDGAHPTSGESQ